MVTAEQIAALKYLIAMSKDGTDTVRRILFFLINASNGLTEQVSVSFIQDKDGYTHGEINKAAHALGAMESSNGATHLDEMMRLMGTPLNFSVHYGHYDETGKFDTEGMFPGLKTLAPGHENDRDGMPLRYTYWLAEGMYGHSGQWRPLVTPSREELMAIDLTKPGLYPRIEAA